MADDDLNEETVPVERERGSSGVSADEPTTTTTGTGVSQGLAGRQIAQYRVIEELGHGGQGFVFLAEDTKLNRKVALKVLTQRAAMSDAARTRFLREAAVASKIDHHGICRVYEFGEFEGMPFIAMQFVQGRPLDREIARSHAAAGSSPTTYGVALESRSDSDDDSSTQTGSSTRRPGMAVLRFIESAARALHVAHEAGLIHRDIKPGNIMVATEGQAVVLDFGLARDDESDAMTLTQTGDFMGTPSYMSPEQLQTHRLKVDRRTDVYSLGVTLYEALTLQRPFGGVSREQLFDAISHRDPPNPQTFNPTISRDLRVVIETAMEKDRDRRYQTALEFAEELRRVRQLEPIHARPAGALLKLQRWAQRNPALAVSLGLFLVVVTASAVGLAFQNRSIEQANRSLAAKTREAERNAERAELKTREAEALADEARRAQATAEEEAETARQVALFMTGLFEESDPMATGGRVFGSSGRKAELSARDILDRGARQLETTLIEQPLVRAQLLDTIGNVYLGLGFADDAEPLISQALELRRQHLGESHIDYGRSLMSRALVNRVRGETCADEIAAVLERQKEILGDDDPELAIVAGELVAQYLAEWRQDEAEALLPEAERLARMKFGEESREFALLLFMKALVQVFRGEPARAVPVVKRALQIMDGFEGDHDLSAIFGIFMKAQIAEKMRQAAAAHRYYEDAIASAIEIVGENHYLVAFMIGTHADFMNHSDLHKGDPAAAENERALRVFRSLFGDKHPLVASRQLSLVRTRSEQGRQDDVIALSREAIAILRPHLESGRSALGGDLESHLDAALRWLGGALLQEGDYEAAEANYRELLRYRRERGFKEQDMAGPQYDLAISLLGRGDLQAAAQAYRQALEWRPKETYDLHELAEGWETTGEIAAARATYQLILELAPEDPRARERLAALSPSPDESR